tara:strand:- start:669 stop:1607 length:939 start_codon:yes stop_codon:yes gene_type:complete
MKKIFWESKSELNKIDWIKKTNKQCDIFLNNSPDDISYLYSYFSLNEHKEFVQEVVKKLNLNLKGVGLELGSGPGILSFSLLKIFNTIDKILLLDKVPNVYKLQDKVSKHLKLDDKVMSITGDFNNLKLEDNSLDFVLDFDSIHHSDNFKKTFSEISRVLKSNGILLCFDRGQPNYVSKKHIEFLVNMEYNLQYKLENGIDPQQKFNRKMNGEHEPYLNDWINVGKKNNLIGRVHIFHTRNLKNLIRNLYGLTPFFIRKILKKGMNITTHYQIILNYFGISKFKNMEIHNLNFKPKKSKTPKGKMVFVFFKV